MLKCSLRTCASSLWEPTWPVCCMFSIALPFKWWQGIRRTGQRDPTVPGTGPWLRRRAKPRRVWWSILPASWPLAAFQFTSKLQERRELGVCRQAVEWQCGRRMGHFRELVCGSWAVGNEDQVRTGLAVKEWAQNRSWELQGYGKGTAVCLLLLLRHTFMTVAVVPFLLFSRVLQLWFLSGIRCLPNPRCSSCHFSMFMGKYNLHMKVETLWGSDAQNATAEVEAAPRREWRGASRDLVWTCASPGELSSSTSSRPGSGAADEGQRVVKLAWKSPTCTIFLTALFSTTFY